MSTFINVKDIKQQSKNNVSDNITKYVPLYMSDIMERIKKSVNDGCHSLYYNFTSTVPGKTTEYIYGEIQEKVIARIASNLCELGYDVDTLLPCHISIGWRYRNSDGKFNTMQDFNSVKYLTDTLSDIFSLDFKSDGGKHILIYYPECITDNNGEHHEFSQLSIKLRHHIVSLMRDRLPSEYDLIGNEEYTSLKITYTPITTQPLTNTKEDVYYVDSKLEQEGN